MIVKLKKKQTRYRNLTVGQPYVVIGIEANAPKKMKAIIYARVSSFSPPLLRGNDRGRLVA